MKHKQVFSIILLSIFVLSHILSLYTAIADCQEKSEETLKGIIIDLEGDLLVARQHLQNVENTGYLETMTETQREMMIAGGVGGGSAAALTSVATGGTLTVPLVATGIFVGSLTGGIVGLIYGYYSHDDALKAARENITNIEQAIAHAKLELQARYNAQAASAILPDQYSISIRNNPHHTVTISANENITSMDFNIMPQSSSHNSLYSHITMTTPHTSTSLWYTFTPAHYKGAYYIEVVLYLESGKVLRTTYQISIGD